MIIADHRQILRDGLPLIDLRSPTEFAQGAFPHAVNLPLLTDPERAAFNLQVSSDGGWVVFKCKCDGLQGNEVYGELYKVRPDVMSVIHTHPTYAVALSATGRKLRPISR